MCHSTCLNYYVWGMSWIVTQCVLCICLNIHVDQSSCDDNHRSYLSPFVYKFYFLSFLSNLLKPSFSGNSELIRTIHLVTLQSYAVVLAVGIVHILIIIYTPQTINHLTFHRIDKLLWFCKVIYCDHYYSIHIMIIFFDFLL